MSQAKGFLPTPLKIDIRSIKGFTENKVDEKEKGREFNALRKHTLMKNMALQTAARSGLDRAGFFTQV